MTREWYFQAMGQEIGPLSAAELKAKVATGQIQPDTLIRKGPEGKWIFGANLKGLFSTPEEPPAAPIAPAAVKPKSSASLPISSGSKPSSHAELPTNTSSKSSATHTIHGNFYSLAEEETDSQPPSVEFYDFVGFREAISPVLHDAVKQFAVDRHITISQLNRRALATFIQRPELASDLSITAIAAVPQPVNAKANQDGRHPLSERERVEVATFRFTLFNSSHHLIDVGEAVFLPENIEQRTYDTIAEGNHPMLDHEGHITVRLDPLETGKAIRMALDVSIPSQSTRDIFVWFHSNDKPSLTKIRGQLLVGHGGELAMSEYFTITLHGDSPSPDL